MYVEIHIKCSNYLTLKYKDRFIKYIINITQYISCTIIQRMLAIGDFVPIIVLFIYFFLYN